MGLIIAIVCIGAGVCLLAPLVVQLLKSGEDETGAVLMDEAGASAGSTGR